MFQFLIGLFRDIRIERLDGLYQIIPLVDAAAFGFERPGTLVHPVLHLRAELDFGRFVGDPHRQRNVLVLLEFGESGGGSLLAVFGNYRRQVARIACSVDFQMQPRGKSRTEVGALRRHNQIVRAQFLRSRLVRYRQQLLPLVLVPEQIEGVRINRFIPPIIRIPIRIVPLRIPHQIPSFPPLTVISRFCRKTERVYNRRGIYMPQRWPTPAQYHLRMPHAYNPVALARKVVDPHPYLLSVEVGYVG